VNLFTTRAGRGLSARRKIASSVRHVSIAGLAGMVSLALLVVPASSETASVYGMTASILSANPGAFLPANSSLVCFSLKESNCWDGKKWHQLYPSGRREYAIATTDQVACSVVVAPRNDCWTGSAWYRLPKGQLFGVIGGMFSNAPGAFITAPLQSRPGTYVSAPRQSPLGAFASER
jgi:hypothetical protein